MRKVPVSLEEAQKKRKAARKQKNEGSAEGARPIVHLQQQVGNRAVQRLLAQRSADGPSALDDQTEERINSQRGSGQPMDTGMQEKMSSATGEDFSQVRVHTDGESDTLNQQLGAKAFTTGSDIFFRAGEYQPHSAPGQELLAHEMTHVVQQRQGGVSSGGPMQVNAPDDAFEQQAHNVASSVTGGQPAAIQREAAPEEEEQVQMQEEEEEQVQMQEEEEEQVQMQEVEEDEEAKA